ncbi:FAD binding domain-containing protein [Microbacterium enclense]|uniref:CO or xanthine dehydrogenase, FAD-binding subunit n=1 Tax=Microbacterium enclense TaxID=993073 RepID=A0A1G6GIV6_9MICO|nr:MULTISPECIES: FAD binding domain-containing protein [Microbacterium]KSU56251.1 FAD-binding molybdopterin dehydrogenase [Microbacterium enclense]MCM3615305.1 FAD binding domain-containing protein [Microbacterium enclense]SDB81938.1 CO or xanthine dehydrogenase, FAD-binding subunit [Microbacterium enclense]
MDITTVTSFRSARTRDDLALSPGEVVIAGGTWLMSEPQPGTTGFVDLTTLGWPDLELTEDGLRIGATCTIARLLAWVEHEAPAAWTSLALARPSADALLASFKIWNTATVGGNVCQAFAAGAMIAMLSTLDATALVWTPDGGERRIAVADLVIDNQATSLAPGEVLRALDVPMRALTGRVALQKIALAELGRSGAVVTARVDADGAAVFVVTAAVRRPRVIRFGRLPGAGELRDAVASAPGFYTDPLGSADWRRGVSVVLAERVRQGFAREVAA